MASTKATDRITTALWSALKTNGGFTAEQGVRIAVEGTGGGCEVLAVTAPGWVIAIHDGDLNQPTGTAEDAAVLYTDRQWAGIDDDYTLVLPDADADTVAETMTRALLGFIPPHVARDLDADA